LEIQEITLMKLKVILEPSDEGGSTVYVPSLPGCISEGNTMEEAMQNIRAAIDLYLEEEPLVLPEKAQVLELVV
jgi:predicted RNase H-like HicB family nuclease